MSLQTPTPIYHNKRTISILPPDSLISQMKDCSMLKYCSLIFHIKHASQGQAGQGQAGQGQAGQGQAGQGQAGQGQAGQGQAGQGDQGVETSLSTHHKLQDSPITSFNL